MANPVAILKGRMIVVGALLLYSMSSAISPFVQGPLGLALAHAVVRQLGGSIEARNRTPLGFEVEIRLPPPDRAGGAR